MHLPVLHPGLSAPTSLLLCYATKIWTRD